MNYETVILRCAFQIVEETCVYYETVWHESIFLIKGTLLFYKIEIEENLAHVFI